MDCLITIKVPQENALQAIMDLQEMGLEPIHFDVGSRIVPVSAPVKKDHTRWTGSTQVEITRIPRASNIKGAVGRAVLEKLGVGWTGTYEELYVAVRDACPVGCTDSTVRCNRAYIKNSGALKVVS